MNMQQNGVLFGVKDGQVLIADQGDTTVKYGRTQDGRDEILRVYEDHPEQLAAIEGRYLEVEELIEVIRNDGYGLFQHKPINERSPNRDLSYEYDHVLGDAMQQYENHLKQDFLPPESTSWLRNPNDNNSTSKCTYVAYHEEGSGGPRYSIGWSSPWIPRGVRRLLRV